MNSERLTVAGSQLAAVSRARQATPTTQRRSLDAARTRKRRVEPIGPTPERLAKGGVLKVGGVFRSVPPIKRLFDSGKLDRNSAVNLALYRAAQKLYGHFRGCEVSIRAFDIDWVAAGKPQGLIGGEGWSQHYERFREACHVMGWHDDAPHHGAGRIVVAVVCNEMSLGEAAAQYLPPGQSALVGAVVMDRLRQGLFSLARHWELLRLRGGSKQTNVEHARVWRPFQPAQPTLPVRISSLRMRKPGLLGSYLSWS